MKIITTSLNFAIAEITLAAITYIEIISEYMRIIAATAATVTLVFAIVKFVHDYNMYKLKKKLLQAQIENEFSKRNNLTPEQI